MRLPPNAWIVLVPAMRRQPCSVPLGMRYSSPDFRSTVLSGRSRVYLP